MEKEEKRMIDKYYALMGYSKKPLYDYYSEQADDLMDYPENERSIYSKYFNLKQSAIDSIKKTLITSSAYQRTSQKSMMMTIASAIIVPEAQKELTEKELLLIIEKVIEAYMRLKTIPESEAQYIDKNILDKINAIIKDENESLTDEEQKTLQEINSGFEALIQTRQTHMNEVAAIAEMISHALGLNADLAYIIGKLHDIGHTWNGHTGERILSAIGQLTNSTYIVHSAMGAYVLEREQVIDDMINNAMNISKGTNIEDIKEFLRYVIDGMVTHNGEGSVGVIVPKIEKSAQEMKEEIRKCFSVKDYDKTIMPATMEGGIIRYADIIAYTRSDIVDGFRAKDENGNKILNEFDDEYLAIIGTLLARKNNDSELLVLENKFIQELYGLQKRIDNLEKIGDKISKEDALELKRTIKEKELIEAKYNEFETIKIENARKYVDSIKPDNKKKIVVPQMMQDVFIMDLVEASKNKPYITMTPLIRTTLFKLRDLNIRRIVPYTRRRFETDILPEAAYELVKEYADVLVETGLAYEMIPEEERDGVISKRSKVEQTTQRRKMGRKNNTDFRTKIYHYYKNQNPKKLKHIYENVLNSINDITKNDLEIALEEEEYRGELKEEYLRDKIEPIRLLLKERGINKETINEEIREHIIEELIEERKNDIELSIASKMAIEYIGGMTDVTINAVLMQENMISRKDLIENYERPEPGKGKEDTGVKGLQKQFGKTLQFINPDGIENDEEITL